jgi:PKD repeat protein
MPGEKEAGTPVDSTATDHSVRRRSRLSIRMRAAQTVTVALLSLVLTGPVVHADHNDDHGNSRPVASFTFSQASPVTGETVTFTSTSSDPDGQVAYQAWDLDNDGRYDDGTASKATRAFGTAGSHTVRLGVVDNDGAFRTTSRTVTVKANGAPVAAFSASPAAPETGQTVTLTSSSTDPDGRPLLQQWDFDKDGVFDDATGGQVTLSFPRDGVSRVSLRVTDSGGVARSTFRDISVRNRPPRAEFDLSETEVDTGEPIDFTSRSTDPDGEISSYRWDFDGDGVTDASDPTPSHSFADDASPTVTLTVTDDDGAAASAVRQVTVRNRAPSASFGYAPAEPMTGDEVVLTSTSNDRDGTVLDRRWDLDGDGAFDDATGAEVRTRFAEAGSRLIALQVVDDDGAASPAAFVDIDVTGRPDPPAPGPRAPDPPSQGPSAPGPSAPGGRGTPGPSKPDLSVSGRSVTGPRLLKPFPRVRVRGVTTPSGARIDALSVRTTGGTRVLVRCKGRGCPWGRKGRSARIGGGLVRVVRIPGFSSRRLRAGTVVEVFVTRAGYIGKYTRITIRRGLKVPMRVDRCTSPGAARVRTCRIG